MSEIIEELESAEEITTERLLKFLLEKDDIELKTEIHNPIAFSILEVFENHVRDKYSFVSDLLKIFINKYRINFVSYDRKSRAEVIDAIKKMAEEGSEIKSLFEKLTQ